jgi:hypothetical protein
MFVEVKIKIRTTKVSKSNMYDKNLNSYDYPMLVKCKPEESPEFLHGRQQTIEFSAVFNSNPYLKTTKEKASEDDLRELMSIKYELINIKDGVKSKGNLEAAKVLMSMKSGMYKPKLTASASFDLTEA